MISEIISMSGALGTGGLIGLLKVGMERWLDSKQRSADAAHRKDLALGNQLIDYQKTIHAAPGEAELEKTAKWEITFFNKKFGYESHRRKETIVRSLGSVSHALALILLVITLCWSCLIWADSPDIVVWTLNPDEKPRTFGLLWGLLDWSIHRTSVSEVTTAGLAYALLHGILGIVGYILVGSRTQPQK